MAADKFKTVYISTATTTLLSSNSGILHSITIGETAAGAITVYDNIVGSGTVLIAFKASVAEQTFTLDIGYQTGLTVVTAGASKVQVSFTN